jgi:transposase
VRAILDDPDVQRSEREYTERYGVLIALCLPRTPEHTGKVEAGVQYVKRNALAGRAFRDVHDATRQLGERARPPAAPRAHAAGARRAGRRTAPRAPLDHLLPRPRCRREEVRSLGK